MTSDLQAALRRAEEAGSASFELRDVTEVIRPATRRVKRQRALVGGVGALGAMAIVAGSWWGLGVVEQSRNFAEVGAGNADGGGATAAALEESAASTSDTPAAGGPPPPTIEALLASATPRTLGEEATGRSAAIACSSEHDPLATAQDSTVNTATVIDDCTPVWVDGTVKLDVSPSTVSFDQADGTVTVSYELVNSGTATLWLYADPYGTIQTNPLALVAEDVSVDGLAVSATTMWTGADSQIGLMNSHNNAQALPPGETLRGTLVWHAATGDEENQIDHILAGDSSFFFTINPRLAQVGYAAPTPLILEVGSPDFGYLTTPTFDTSGSDERVGG